MSMQEQDTEITNQLRYKIQPLIDYADFLLSPKAAPLSLSRPLLSLIKANSELAEEMLDSFGARFNKRWFPMRETVAILKNFSTAAYELLHVFQSSGVYDLGSLNEFQEDLQGQICFFTNILSKALQAFAKQTSLLDMKSSVLSHQWDFKEPKLLCRLPKDRDMKYAASVKQRVDFLSIHILNSTEEVNQFKKMERMSPEDWDKLDFDFLCETKLRNMEVNMHILQALYDTYIADSATENDDADLVSLRGRISVALHLLRIVTICQHFYERHMTAGLHENAEGALCQICFECINLDEFRSSILKFYAHYLAMYITDARHICSNLLKKYCVTKTVEVKAPPYIGFHVRPSSLIAAIVLHYGCAVEMSLGDTVYDASVFANIAMANNYLDQKKRAYLSQKLLTMDFSHYEREIASGVVTKLEAVKEILMQLASQDLIRIYATHLHLTELPVEKEASLNTTVFETIKYLMNTDRQVGIVYAATVKFTGPEQAIDDIAALADANYAESEQGEDLPLPKQLDYLNFRRKTIKRPVRN